MSLFPDENILTKETEYWRGFADSLESEEDKKLFLEVREMSEVFASYKFQGKTVSNRAFVYGTFARAAQNDKLVRK